MQVNKNIAGNSISTLINTAVTSEVTSAVDTAVASAVPDAVDTALDSVLDGVVDAAVNAAVDTAVDMAVDDAVDTAVSPAVDIAVSAAVPTAVTNAVNLALPSAVTTAVTAAVPAAVSTEVSTAVPTAVSAAVSTAVPSAVTSAVNSAVPTAVSTAVSAAVPTAVTSAVNSAVPTAVSTALALGFSDGTASAPSVHPASDSTSGTYFTSGTLNYSVNGVKRMKLESTGLTITDTLTANSVVAGAGVHVDIIYSAGGNGIFILPSSANTVCTFGITNRSGGWQSGDTAKLLLGDLNHYISATNNGGMVINDPNSITIQGSRISCTDTTDATSTSVASVVLNGGFACAKNLYTGTGYNNVYSAKIRAPATQSISSGSWVQITGLSTVVYDTSPSVNMTSTTTITIQKTGVYLINAYGNLGSNTTGGRECRILKNGTVINTNDLFGSLFPLSSVDNSFINMNHVTSLASGDILRMYVYQDSGSSLTYGGTSVKDGLSLGVTFMGYI